MISRTVILETEKAISFGFNLLKNKCIKFICYCRLLDYHDLSTRMIVILNRVQDCRYQKFSHTKLISLFFQILSNARPKNNVNQVPRWVFRYVGNKTFDFSRKNQDFLPKIGIFVHFGPGLAGSFGALLVVVVARGLYLARHLFTLLYKKAKVKKTGMERTTPQQL